MIRPDPSQFESQPPRQSRLHPVEYILLASVATGLLAFVGLAWRALT